MHESIPTVHESMCRLVACVLGWSSGCAKQLAKFFHLFSCPFARACSCFTHAKNVSVSSNVASQLCTMEQQLILFTFAVMAVPQIVQGAGNCAVIRYFSPKHCQHINRAVC